MQKKSESQMWLLLLLMMMLLLWRVESHNEGAGAGHCDAPDQRLEAENRVGSIGIDGRGDEWEDVDGFSFPLLPALDPDEDKQYSGGKIKVKAAHDGENIFFLLQVSGDYSYVKGDQKRCPSVALMFQVGESATYHNMGGCEQSTDACTPKTCRGHEVDIMHFSIGTAVPGHIYGGNHLDNGKGNGGDRFGHLVDLYSWNPHCRYVDGLGPSGNDSSAQNDWKGAWWHDSFNTPSGFVEDDSPYATNGQKGSYSFEFSRPLRTMDHLQQDVQFAVGKSAKLAVAFWYPNGGVPYGGHEHYSANCEWIQLDIALPIGGTGVNSQHSNPKDGLSAFALLLSVAAFCISVFIAYSSRRPRQTTNFTPLDNL